MNRFVHQPSPVVDGGRVVDLLERKDIDQQILLSTPHMGVPGESTSRRRSDQLDRATWSERHSFGTRTGELSRGRACSRCFVGYGCDPPGAPPAGVGPGDRVLLNMTFAASANPIMYQGAEPVSLIRARTWNMSPLLWACV